MPLPLPNLDDRDFEQLLAEARQRIRQTSTGWDDLSESDPGVVLLELFAYLTDTMIYRLNRLPNKVYIAFLRLLGVSLHPPSAASTTLRFSRTRGFDAAVEIPRGTRVTLERTGADNQPPVFMTTETVSLPAGTDSVDAPALHAEQVEGELVGTATGLPGFSVTVARAPIISGTGDPLDLVVAVEAADGELDERVPAIKYNDATYRIWREVENFANPGDDPFIYIVDRMSGTITFAPSLYSVDEETGTLSLGSGALGSVPPAGRAIRVWYRRGGGADGNVAANTLTALKDPIRGVQVTNPAPATGGRDAEALENALLRGPKELHSLQRAVTADDFELVALKTLEVARAKAFTRASVWSYAQRGAVEMVLVPDVPESAWQGSWLPKATLMEYATEEAREQVQRALDQRRPLGTECLVTWAHYKTVRVTANIVVRREENPDAVKNRVHERLHRTINPLPSDKYNSKGWQFGQALRVSNVYDVTLSEPGVRWVDNVSLMVDEVPAAVTTVAADAFQPNTWYAGSENHVFRSLNNGDGWETAISFGEDERVLLVRSHAGLAGMVAAMTRIGEDDSRVYVSRDCGESWQNVTNTDFQIEDMAWMLRDKMPVLLLATDRGLYELNNPGPNTNIEQILVDPNNQAMRFYAVTTATNLRGEVSVAVAAQESGGVYLSFLGGRPNTFGIMEGMNGLDVRVLEVQYKGPRAWLWAGTYAASGDDVGKGCFRWELRGAEDPPSGWFTFDGNWKAGSCRGLSFMGDIVFAATHRAGIVRLDSTKQTPQWETPDINSGLPLRDLARGRFITVDTIAANPAGTMLMAGVAGTNAEAEGEGIYRAAEQGDAYAAWKFTRASTSRFTDKVTLPETWLFASGDHEITVVSEDETG